MTLAFLLSPTALSAAVWPIWKGTPGCCPAAIICKCCRGVKWTYAGTTNAGISSLAINNCHKSTKQIKTKQKKFLNDILYLHLAEASCSLEEVPSQNSFNTIEIEQSTIKRSVRWFSCCAKRKMYRLIYNINQSSSQNDVQDKLA